MDVSAAGTIVSGGKLGLACGDAGGTVRFFAYAQNHPLMWRGKRLLPLCAPHCALSCLNYFGILGPYQVSACFDERADHEHKPTQSLCVSC